MSISMESIFGMPKTMLREWGFSWRKLSASWIPKMIQVWSRYIIFEDIHLYDLANFYGKCIGKFTTHTWILCVIGKYPKTKHLIPQDICLPSIIYYNKLRIIFWFWVDMPPLSLWYVHRWLRPPRRLGATQLLRRRHAGFDGDHPGGQQKRSR